MFYFLGSVFFLLLLGAVLIHEPPVGDTVTATKLSRAVDMAAQYPTEAGPFVAKINAATLTNGEFILLEAAIKPAQERKTVERRRTESPLAYWLLDRSGALIFAFIGIVYCAFLKLYQQRTN